MNDIVIGTDEKTTYNVFFDNPSKLFHILGQQEQLRFTIDGITFEELKQLRKELNNMFRDKKIMKKFGD